MHAAVSSFRHIVTAYPSVSIRDQTELHDFLQQDGGGIEDLGQELNAVRTQTLVVQRNLDLRRERLLPDGHLLHTLFLNLKGNWIISSRLVKPVEMLQQDQLHCPRVARATGGHLTKIKSKD